MTSKNHVGYLRRCKHRFRFSFVLILVRKCWKEFGKVKEVKMLRAAILLLGIAAVFGGTIVDTEKNDVIKWLEKLEERVKALEAGG